YYVNPDGCLVQAQQAYGVLYVLLALHSAYFWRVDRPRVLRAMRQAVASGQLTIRKSGRSYEIDQGKHSISVGMLWLMTVVTALMLPCCFWDPMVAKMCAGQLRGHPPIALVMVGTFFVLVVMQQVLTWAYATMAIWKVSE